MRRVLLSILFGFMLPALCWADAFKVQDIRIDGLQRLDLGTVLRGLGIEVGDNVDEFTLANSSRDLFALGYFNDIQLSRDGDVLIVTLVERPSLSRIELEGNEVIETEVLLDGLSRLGLQEGEVFQRATLEKIRIDLARVYSSYGRYNAWIDTKTEELPENRIGLKINIKEGSAASIHHINIVGNEVYSDEELRALFELNTPGFWSFFLKDDRYSREKLSGDLERLRSHYLNNGYINFDIESTQVSLTPDLEDVYITINVKEGERFYFGDVQISGRIPNEVDIDATSIPIEKGAVFSREVMVGSAEYLSGELGKFGYLRANVSPTPKVDHENHTVSLQFFVDPGRRMYVRRIDFKGNSSSSDEVLRREMRQMEAAWASTEKIEQSKQRLERLGYYETVNVETKPVVTNEDQVDLEYSVIEQLSGNLSASVGFSDNGGVILGLQLAQRNFLGSGKDVSVKVSNSDALTEYNFSYSDPYYTVDGVSRGFDVFYRKEDFDEEDVSDYNLNTLGGNINFGYPINEYQSLNFEFGYERSEVVLGSGDVPIEITDFVAAEGTEYDGFKTYAAWTDNRLNKGLMPTDGYSQSLSLEAYVPGSDLTYYKMRYRWQQYWPITDDDGWVFKLGSRLGYAESYGDTSEVPFFKNFFSGGFNSVRGFKNNSLGPRSNNSDEDPLGGNVQIEGSAELIFPFPLVDDQSSLRSLFFFDVGNVFDTSCNPANPNCVEGVDLSELRGSVGIGVSWLTFIGPLSFSIATPVIDEPGDETEFFQFTLGRTF